MSADRPAAEVTPEVRLTESERKAIEGAFDDNPDATGDWLITRKEWQQLFAAVADIKTDAIERALAESEARLRTERLRLAHQVEFDFTGQRVDPSVEYVKQHNPVGHGDLATTTDLTVLRLACSVLGARDGSPGAVPGSEGTVVIRLSTAALRRIRDEIDALVGLAEEVEPSGNPGADRG